MTFHEILEKLVEETPGALAAAIMGDDGIPIDEFRAAGARIDVAATAVEFQRVVQEARKTAGTLYESPSDGLRELILITGGHQLLFREIDDEYFVVVALTIGGTLGKARYLVRSLLQELRNEL